MSYFETWFNELRIWAQDPLVVQVFFVVFSTALASYFLHRVMSVINRRAEASQSVWDDAFLRTVSKPSQWLIWVMGLSVAAELIAEHQSQSQLEMIATLRYLALIVLITLFVIRMAKEIEKGYIASGGDETTVTAIAKLARISIVITAVLMVMQSLGVSISGVLAFGGIGGIAVGFAAKDLLANFFGGLVIYMDRPFKVGDWIRSPDRDIEGTVVKIGWRLTEIRTFDQRPLYVPNSAFSTIALENPSRMLNRRIYETIGIRYDDIQEMHAIVAAVKAMLQAHPAIAQDKTMIVNFNAFNASSVDFMVYTFTKTTNWIEFHEIKQAILLEIAGIIRDHGAEIAYPTQTLHFAEPVGISASEPTEGGPAK
ncbi:MAG: mechanosensitive ion channel family protein [Pseudomonadales bacterium]